MAEPLKSKKNQRTHLKNIAHLGGAAIVKKYGKVAQNERGRLLAWRTWWEQKGRLTPHSITNPKAIRIPPLSPKLAEFVGIMLGDGGITTYFITITLNSKTDKLYGRFISRLIKDLFGVIPKVYMKKNADAFNVVVHRKSLIDFCTKIGLMKGSKITHGAHIPLWVEKKDAWKKACLRGLFDTDGSVYIHRYHSKKKWYAYPKMSFSNRSPKLIADVQRLLTSFCISSKIHYNGTEVRIESSGDLKRFMALIGTNNPKHKILNFKRRGE